LLKIKSPENHIIWYDTKVSAVYFIPKPHDCSRPILLGRSPGVFAKPTDHTAAECRGYNKKSTALEHFK
jgi:hypothetical protein